MARAGTQRWRNPTPEGDDVQRSIELLDKVLSEYDEHEAENEVCIVGGGGGGGGGGGDGGNGSGSGGGSSSSSSGGGAAGDEVVVVGNGRNENIVVDGLLRDCGSSTEPSIGLTPDDESPSLGHQSEDDGYMSMNGRKAKMALLALRPVPDCPEPQDSAGLPSQEFPPPPEEAERIISTLLPIVSPGNSSKRTSQSSERRSGRQQWMIAMEDSMRHGNAVTTQTTLPKTRHRRPYGWENGNTDMGRTKREPSSSPPSKFASLPYDTKVSFNWIPPRTNPCTIEKHREVRRRSSEEDLERDRRRKNADKDRTSHLRKQRQNEIMKSSSVEDRLLMNHNHSHSHNRIHNRRAGGGGGESCGRGGGGGGGGGGEGGSSSNGGGSNGGDVSGDGGGGEEIGARRRRNDSDSSEGRFSRNSESERSSIPRSSSVSVERFSMRANCDSSDFSRANSTSNERFHSDFSIAVASASSNDHVSIPTSDPFSIRNLDFVSFSLPRAESSERFSGRTSDRCSEERYSDMFSTRNSDFSTRNSTDFRTQSEEERFSDDSLEELLPPPPPISKRHSIAWEVSLEDDPLYAPGSTKVVGRRRRKSSDVSSVGSASKLRDFDDWQDPRLSTTDDDLVSPYSDSSTNDLDQIRPQDLTKNGTYVIRRGRKKERKVLPKTATKTKSLSFENAGENRLSDVKRYSTTFDNIKSLLKDSKMEADKRRSSEDKSEDLDDLPNEFVDNVPPPDLIRVVSLPINNNDNNNNNNSNDDDEDDEEDEEEDEDESNDRAAHLGITIDDEETSGGKKLFCKMKERQIGEISRERLPLNFSISKDSTDLGIDRECNGGIPLSISASKALDIGKPIDFLLEERSKKLTSSSSERLSSKIPVNLLIEDQIVKKALNENRRQLEKVSDAIKEIENVKNSESYSESKRWKNGDVRASSRRNSYENDSIERANRKTLGSPYEPRNRKQQSSDSETSKTSSESDFDRRKANGTDIYASGRRLRQNGIESHKNNQKQIEHVIDAILEDSKNPDFQVSVEVLEFPPLPPSPVEEADEESSDVGQNAVISSTRSKSHSNRTMEYRPRVPPHRSQVVDTKDHQTSLNTRSMDAGFSRGRRTPTASNSRREVPVERRTLPTDLPGPSSRRRPFAKRNSPSTDGCISSVSGVNGGGVNGGGTVHGSANGGANGGGTNSGTATNVVAASGTGMQTSCSLPETPVFARGSDIPRTPQHAGNQAQTRRQPGWYAPTTATTGYRRNNPGLEQAIIGTELLRLAGGPNRGWYPTRKANQPRPASIEHLERLNNAYDARLPTGTDQRKPLTLPTNITPNKYFGQSKHSSASSTREALRRVTSLLIKKGSGSKDGKSSKDNALPSGPYAAAESGEAPKKKGFFKGFWKRSRHYSLENQ